MLSRFLAFLYRRWRLRSLRAKLILPIVGLMLFSLLGSTLAFVGGAVLTHNHLLRRQITADGERIAEAMAERVERLSTAAQLLANDPEVLAAVPDATDAALSVLNGRAVVIRDRFELDLIQIYDQGGEARTNLVLASLYRETSLMDQVAVGQAVVRVVANRMLLLSRAEMPDGAGTVVVGIDLETELQRLVSEYHLPSNLGLRFDTVTIATREALPFDAPEGRVNGQYSRWMPVNLGATPVELLLVRPTTDVTQVVRAGLAVMVGSSLFTTLLLMGLGVVIARALTEPIQRLSAAAEAVAGGDLSHQVEPASSALPVGNEDEIGLLAAAFNAMVAELRSLYGSLETKVETRTRELATAAEVARAISSSLDREVVLQTSVRLIRERLGHYFVAIFLVDTAGEMVRLCEATGEVGQKLRDRMFQIDIGSQSLVGSAAATGDARIVQNVRLEPMYLENSLLPDTCAEAAIPLLIGKAVIGVLDVQSVECEVFTPERVNLLVTLADQIAIGVHNAQLYARQRETSEHLAAANRRLQELDRMKNEFIQNVSHELRTPLALIRGYAEALEMGMLGELQEDQRHPVLVIARRSRILSELVEDITALLEVEAREASREPVSLPALVRAVVDDFQTLVEEKELSLWAEIAPDLPLVFGEERHLRKVVDNLVNNAIKFTPAQGKIVVRLSQESKCVILQVRDTGIGIPPEKQAHVFDRFYQVDGSIKRRYGGTGLGLALVKEIVEAHEGQVTLESEPGEGSIFTVTLPALNGNNGGALEASTNGETEELEYEQV